MFAKALRTTVIAMCLVQHVPGQAASSQCPERFYAGQAPDLVNPKLSSKSRELCFSEFAVLHSGMTRTPLYSADHLTEQSVRAALKQHRSDAEETFHEEERLPAEERSWLSDYSRGGFDRGHLSPNGDFDNAHAQGESFSLANMMPQNPDNNRNLWEGVEEATRGLATRYGEVWVVTVPIFPGAHTRWLHDRVAIPGQIAKAVYIPSLKRAGVYLVDNEPGMRWKVVSVAELRTLSGIDAFPGLSEEVKSNSADLPEPTPHEGNGKHRSGGEPAERAILHALRHF